MYSHTAQVALIFKIVVKYSGQTNLAQSNYSISVVCIALRTFYQVHSVSQRHKECFEISILFHQNDECCTVWKNNAIDTPSKLIVRLAVEKK